MFTGIIETTASVTQASESKGARQDGDQDCKTIRVATGFAGLELGESIAVDGACLTVAEIPEAGVADFFVSQETLAKTNLSRLKGGERVNLERALKLASGLSGHWVQGHVDAVARVEETETVGETYRLAFRVPSDLSKYLVPKGSLTLNGVSLTVNRMDGDVGECLLIPHTLKKTNLADFPEGSSLNLEVDILAKYVERLCQPYLMRSPN